MLQDRSLGLIQPDVTRSGGITETWRIAELAASFNTAYAPHVGWSGAICVAASLQLAAAAETLRTFECMVYANPLRDCVHASRGRRRHPARRRAAHRAAGAGARHRDRPRRARAPPDRLSDAATRRCLPAFALVSPVQLHGRRRHLPAGDLRALAQPAPVLLRAGGELRRPRQLRQGAGRPYFWRALFNTVIVVASSCMSNCCSASAWRCSSPPACRSAPLMLAIVLAPYAVSEVSAVVMWRYLFEPDVGLMSQLLGTHRACRRSNGR